MDMDGVLVLTKNVIVIRDGREKVVEAQTVLGFLIAMIRVFAMGVLNHHGVSTVLTTPWVERASCLVFMAMRTHLTALYVNVSPATQAKPAILNVQDTGHAQTTLVYAEKGGKDIFVNCQIVLEILIVLDVVYVYEHQRMSYLNASAIKALVDQIVASYSVPEIPPVTTAETVF